MIRLVVKFLKALWHHVVVNEPITIVPELAKRLNACLTCDYRSGDWCDKCGCFIPYKALWEDQRCDEGRW